MLTLGIFLSTFTLLSSCSDGLEDLSIDKEVIQIGSETVNDNSILHFLTMEELENISASDIPGDHTGYNISELKYECVDTIELRALRFNVTATLSSATQPAKTVKFAAEVGPELVSVEYYPTGEIIPHHCNITNAFFPKVERFRNYSDGSRIGPDEFYDDGSFILFKVIYPFSLETGLGKPSFDFDRISVGVLDYDLRYEVFDLEYTCENGIYNTSGEGYIKYNLNTSVIDDNGCLYTGEDFIPNHIENNWAGYCSGARDRLSNYIGNYYCSSDTAKYFPTILADTTDPETLKAFNLCRDIPDVSPKPFPKDTKELQPGWYRGDVIDVGKEYALMSKFLYSNDWNCPIIFKSWSEYCLHYLAIDGRIIHFDNLMSTYERINNIKPLISISKVNNGYLLRSEIEATIYGAKFKSFYNINLIGVEGPVDEFDYLDYDILGNKDNDEMSNLTRSSDGRNSTIQKVAPRFDGKRIVIDKTLPNSIKNINKCQK